MRGEPLWRVLLAVLITVGAQLLGPSATGGSQRALSAPATLDAPPDGSAPHAALSQVPGGLHIHRHLPLVFRNAGAWSTPRVPTRTPPQPGFSFELEPSVVLGQPNERNSSTNEIVPNRTFNPGGTVVDRTVRPNRLYVVDTMNSRILGFSSLGTCSASGGACSADGDCASGRCVIDEAREPDLVIGQPTGYDEGACNGDNRSAVPARADTLCLPLYPQVLTTLEWRGAIDPAVDDAGNLYVVDKGNHRLLRYDSPFSTDTVADDVWGQASLSRRACNRGEARPGPDTMCQTEDAGVAIDGVGAIWVTDSGNGRVLRFPYGEKRADLVLGQPDFQSADRRVALDRMHVPVSVAVRNADGSVYVADKGVFAGPDRVLVFRPPLTSGMAATEVWPWPGEPNGMGWDTVTNGLWISDKTNRRTVLVDPDTGHALKVLNSAQPDRVGCIGGEIGDRPRRTDMDNVHNCASTGGVGVQEDGTVWLTGATHYQGAFRFPAPIPTPSDLNHSWDVALLAQPWTERRGNKVGSRGFSGVNGVAVAGDQLIVADAFRLLFWNDRHAVVTGQRADGVIGQKSFESQIAWGAFHNTFEQLHVDGSGRLWAAKGRTILVYATPLKTGDEPVATFTGSGSDPGISIAPFFGSGMLEWFTYSAFPVGDGTTFWLADAANHRVMRVRRAFSNPYVDIVLGQPNFATNTCNTGADGLPGEPDAQTLCGARSVAVDAAGNVFVADSSVENALNRRVLQYDAADIPANPRAPVFRTPARRVFGQPDFRATRLCGQGDPWPRSPADIAFGPNGEMVIVDYCSWRAHVFLEPLARQEADFQIPVPLHAPVAAAFTPEGALLVADTNWHRLLIFPAARLSTGTSLTAPRAPR